MRFLFLLLLIVSGFAWYGSMDNNFAPWAISIKEWNQQLPFPIWMLSLGSSVIVLLLSLRRAPQITYTPPTQQSKNPATTQHQKKLSSKGDEHPQAKSSHLATDGVEEEWKQEIAAASQKVEFPRGGQIMIDSQKDIPFTLRLPHGTPQSYKDAVVRFAAFVSQIPTPKRTAIRFDEGCKKNDHNMVRGIFRKHFHINEMMIRSESNRVDIQFKHMDQRWGTISNIQKDFT